MYFLLQPLQETAVDTIADAFEVDDSGRQLFLEELKEPTNGRLIGLLLHYCAMKWNEKNIFIEALPHVDCSVCGKIAHLYFRCTNDHEPHNVCLRCVFRLEHCNRSKTSLLCNVPSLSHHSKPLAWVETACLESEDVVKCLNAELPGVFADSENAQPFSPHLLLERSFWTRLQPVVLLTHFWLKQHLLQFVSQQKTTVLRQLLESGSATLVMVMEEAYPPCNGNVLQWLLQRQERLLLIQHVLPGCFHQLPGTAMRLLSPKQASLTLSVEAALIALELWNTLVGIRCAVPFRACLLLPAVLPLQSALVRQRQTTLNGKTYYFRTILQALWMQHPQVTPKWLNMLLLCVCETDSAKYVNVVVAEMELTVLEKELIERFLTCAHHMELVLSLIQQLVKANPIDWKRYEKTCFCCICAQEQTDLFWICSFNHDCVEKDQHNDHLVCNGCFVQYRAKEFTLPQNSKRAPNQQAIRRPNPCVVCQSDHFLLLHL